MIIIMIIMLVQQHRPRRPRSRWPSLPRLQIRDERLLGLQRREDGCPMSCLPDDSRSVLLTASSAASLQMLSVLTALVLPSRTSLRASCCFRPVGEWPRRFSSICSASQRNSITKSSSHFSAGLKGTVTASNRRESSRRGATCRAEALAASDPSKRRNFERVMASPLATLRNLHRKS